MGLSRSNQLLPVALLFAVILLIDRVLPAGVSASVLYVIPILLTLRTGSLRSVYATTLLALLATLLDLLLIEKHIYWPNEMLSMLAQLTTALLVHMQIMSNEQTEAERRRLALMHQVVETTSSSMELERVLKDLSENIVRLFKADTAAMWLADESGKTLSPALYNDEDLSAIKQLPDPLDWESSPTAIAESVRRRGVVIVGTGHDSLPATEELMRGLGMQTGVAIPLFARDRLVGVMSVAFRSKRQISRDDIALIETTGKQISIAVEKARLFSSVNKQRERLERINEIGQVFASTLDLESIYLAIREKLGEVVDCDSLLISFYDDETETIRCEFAYTDGKVISPERFEPLKLGKGPHSQCIRTGKPIRVDDIARRAPGTYRYVGDSQEYPVSIIYVPMIAEEKVIGVLQAQSLRPAAYSEEDEPLLSIIANLAASAIENARLYRDAVAGRRAMEQANKVKEDFLATLSHELRTPLTPILGWTRVLRMLADDERETRARGLKVIERNARLQAQLVNDLLDVSRIESGKFSIFARPTELNATVLAAAESVRGEAEDRGINISFELGAGDVLVLADPARLLQIITNLLTNAVKFTGDGGRVTITTDRDGGRAAVKVSDNGAGIDKDFLPHVFEKFRQADGSTSRKHGGLGLGLSIVKSLVEIHGGEVTAESDGAGTGATFTVRLPVAAPSAPEPRPKEADANAATAQGLRMLLVEDDADTVEMMKVICNSRGMTVIGETTAEKGMARLQREAFDIIVSDILLPHMSGLEFARQVRAFVKTGSIPLIALTGLTSEQDRARAIEAGYDAYIPKPIDYTRLFETIEELTKARVF